MDQRMKLQNCAPIGESSVDVLMDNQANRVNQIKISA